jgi:hypothetical protein
MAYRAGFLAQFDQYYRTGVYVDGCLTQQIYLYLHVYLPDSGYYNDRLRRFIPTYIIPLNCSDVGGTATPADAWTDAASVGIEEDCFIALMDWLETLTVVTTFSFDPCECPP